MSILLEICQLYPLWCGHGMQVLLLIPVSIISQSPQMEHYPALLPLIPILGVLWSCWTMFRSLIILCSTNQSMFFDINRAKLRALQNLLNVQSSIRFCIPPLHYFILLYFKLILLMNPSKTRREEIQSSIVWLDLWGKTVMLHVLVCLVEFFGFLIAVGFLVLWIVILSQESILFNQNCSDWNDTTCQGSELYCNDLLTKQQCPA